MALRTKQLLIGCGIAGLLVVVLAVGSCAGFYLWLKQPGELLEPDLLVGGDTTGYVAWTLRLEDPGTREFAQHLLESVQRLSKQNSVSIHPTVDSWLSRWEQRRTEKKIQELFPLAAAWTLRPSDRPGEDLHLFSVSLMRAGNQLRLGDWILGFVLARSPDMNLVSHRGEKIFQVADASQTPFAFFIHGNDVFVTSDVETARLAVDRMTPAEAERAPPGALHDLLGGLPETPLRGAISNEDGELSRVWARIAGGEDPGDPWSGVRGVTLSGRLMDGDTLALEMRFRCTDAVLAAERTEEIAGVLRSTLEPGGFPMELRAVPDGEWVRVDLELRELTATLEDAVGSTARRAVADKAGRDAAD